MKYLFNLIKGIIKYLFLVYLRAVASRLDNAWKGFASGLDERTNVLALSTLFHQKAETVCLWGRNTWRGDSVRGEWIDVCMELYVYFTYFVAVGMLK